MRDDVRLFTNTIVARVLLELSKGVSATAPLAAGCLYRLQSLAVGRYAAVAYDYGVQHYAM